MVCYLNGTSSCFTWTGNDPFLQENHLDRKGKHFIASTENFDDILIK